VIQFDRFVSIPIERLRDSSSMRPVEGRRKVFVLREADRMLELQQNALLKVLEGRRGPAHLTTARPQASPPHRLALPPGESGSRARSWSSG
jgi:hypothetical protein